MRLYAAAPIQEKVRQNARNRHLHPLLLDLSLAGKGQMTATRSWSRDMLGSLLALLLLLPTEVVGMAVRPKLILSFGPVHSCGRLLERPPQQTPAQET